MDRFHDTRYPTDPIPVYDERYLAGIVWFNRGDYFEAHEVWEDLWHECGAADRRFYQSLIQAAVALYHWGNGNRAGASRLFESGRRYMEPYRPHYRGLDVDRFWGQVRAALAGALSSPSPLAGEGGPRSGPGEGMPSEVLLTPDPSPARGEGNAPRPRIALDPPPQAWPDPPPDPDTDGPSHE